MCCVIIANWRRQQEICAEKRATICAAFTSNSALLQMQAATMGGVHLQRATALGIGMVMIAGNSADVCRRVAPAWIYECKVGSRTAAAYSAGGGRAPRAAPPVARCSAAGPRGRQRVFVASQRAPLDVDHTLPLRLLSSLPHAARACQVRRQWTCRRGRREVAREQRRTL